MATKTAVLLTDAESTPVVHTFAPAGTKEEVEFWEDRAAGIPAGFPILSMSLRDVANGPKPGKILKVKLKYPIMETISGANLSGYVAQPQEAFVLEVDLTVRLPSRSALQHRKNCRAMFADLMSEGVLTDLWEKLEPVY